MENLGSVEFSQGISDESDLTRANKDLSEGEAVWGERGKEETGEALEAQK